MRGYLPIFYILWSVLFLVPRLAVAESSPRHLKMRKRSVESYLSSHKVISEISIEDQRSVHLLRLYQNLRQNYLTRCPISKHFPGGDVQIEDMSEPYPDPPPPVLIPNPPSEACDYSVPANDRMMALLNMDPTQLIVLANYTDLLVDPVGPLKLGRRDIPLLRAYAETLLLGDDEAALTKYFETKVKGNFTTDETLLLVQMKMERWHHGYDKDRNDKSFRAKGVVTLSQLMAAEQNNNEIEFYGELGGSSAYADYAGVCRDIMSAGGKLLQAAGFPNVLTVSFVKTNTIHTTVAAQDPDHPLTLYKLNWGARLTSKAAEGGQALFQGGADATSQYILAEPNGRVVAYVPSEFGKTGLAAAGFKLDDLDPLLHRSGSMLKIKDSDSPVDIFMATDGNGASYFGVSKEKKWGTDENGLHAGVAVGIQHRPAAAFGTEKDVDYDFVYAQLEKHSKDTLLEVDGAKLKATIERIYRVILTGGRDREGGNIIPWISPTSDLRIALEAGDEESRAQAKISAGGQFAPGISDVRNGYWRQYPTVVINHLIFSAEGRARLSDSPEGRAYLKAATYVLVDYFGTRGKAVLGFEYNKLSIAAALEGRLSEDMAPYKEGTIKKVTGNARYTLEKGISLEIDAYRTLEDEGNTDFRNSTSVIGNLTIER